MPESPGRGYFKARFEGSCKGCGAPIYVGEWVAYSAEEPGQLFCQPCREAERRGER